MYQITCDDYLLYDPRDANLVVLNPKCKLEVNTVGEGSFTILSTHPYYGQLKKLKSIFEIRQDGQTIFRGRMTNDSRDFNNQLAVDLEGVLAFTNDSIIPPFRFPEDFPDAANAANVVEYFLRWLIEDQHNGQVENWQKLYVGNVTVTDPNNVITRSSEKYLSTWEALKTKLFESELGGYLCIRYESDKTYLDYVRNFELTNTQRITLGENLLDLINDSDATETYSAILPLGAEIENEDGTKTIVTLEGLEDGDLTADLVKKGKFIYSKSAVEQFGWKCVPVEESTWEDVTLVENLKTKAMTYLTGTAMLLSNTITIKAVDLHFTDDEIQSFRVYRNILVDSPAHGVSGTSYPLTKLDIDLVDPQNTTITIGDTVRTLIDVNSQNQSSTIERIESAEKDIADNRSEVGDVKNQMIIQETELINTCNQIIMSALESYVATGDYDEFRQTVAAQLEIMADEISMNFSTTTEQINDVDGDLQSKFTQLYKYISFSGETAITIGSGDSAITLEIDNEKGIIFKRNGVQFGLWDGENFYTGNIIIAVNERAQFGNFAFIPRSDGSLSFLKVGG